MEGHGADHDIQSVTPPFSPEESSFAVKVARPDRAAASSSTFRHRKPGGTVSTISLPPLDDWSSEWSQAHQQMQKVLIESVVEAVSKEVNRSMQACMVRLESKLIDDVREAGAQSVADHIGKLVPLLEPQMLAEGRGGISAPCVQMTGCPSLGSASHVSGVSAPRQAGLPRSNSRPLGNSNNISERSVKELERELAHQHLEDCGFRHLARKVTSSSAMSRSRSSATSRATLMDQVVPTAPANASATAAERSEDVAGFPDRKVAPSAGRTPAQQTIAAAAGAPPLTADEDQMNPTMMTDRPSWVELPGSANCTSDRSIPGDDTVALQVSAVVTTGEEGPQVHETPPKRSPSPWRMTASQVLRWRVHELTDGIPEHFVKAISTDTTEASEELDGAGALPPAPFAMRVCGMVPWTSAWPVASSSYQVLIWLISLAACLGIVWKVVSGTLVASGEMSPGRALFEPVVSQLPLALGAVIGLAVLSRCGCKDSLADDVALLQAVAFKQEFAEQWERRMWFDKLSICFVWSVAVAAEAAATLGSGGLEFVGLAWAAQMLAFVIASGILLGLVFCMLYVCRALTLMVDIFCSRIVDWPDLDTTLDEWNVLQAVLRKTSSAIEYCFVVLQIVMVFTMPLLLADLSVLDASFDTAAKLLPSACIVFGVFRAFTLAASITDKCTRVPAIINSLSFGRGTDRDRQHVVDYIVSSAAGFYVCDVRLNMAMAFKFMYGWSVIAFGLITHVFATD